MQRIFIASIALAGGCLAPAGDESFIIRDNIAIAEGGACSVLPVLGGAVVPRGQIFLDSPTPYLFNPLMESRITAAAGKESLRTIIVKGANVSLQIGPIEHIDVNGNVTIDDAVTTAEFKTLFTTSLPPNGGLAAAQFDLIPLSALADIRARAGTTDRIHAQVIATATAFGDYYGDQIESSPFQYPVTVCNDCVVKDFGDCSTADLTSAIHVGNACNVFQDGLVDCCEDLTRNELVCPATAGPPPGG